MLSFVRAAAWTAALGFVASASASASDMDPIVRAKLQEEIKCMERSTGPDRAACLSELTDWWWHESPKYDTGGINPVNQIRSLLFRATAQDETDVDLFTSYLWMVFSRDINAITDGKRNDVTKDVIQLIERRRARGHEGNFGFFFVCTDEAIRFTMPNNVGSKQSKLAYLAYARKLHARALELWPALKGKLSPEQVAQIEFQIGATERIMDRRQQQLEKLVK